MAGGRVKEIKMPNRKRDSKGRFDNGSFMSAAYDRPLTSAAVAAGVAAAGAFLWSRRGQIGEAVSSGMDRLSELKAERMGHESAQEDQSEETLTLKETGRKSRGPIAQREIKSGLARTR
jgi:hypothetical protein